MLRKANLAVKRLFDILISMVGIIVCFPFWVIIIFVMKITMPGPVFFKQERVGKGFEIFSVIKFRSMKVDKESEKNFKIQNDKNRITWFGNILRRTKLDESPQLINVLLGDMSLVGPRPTVKQRVDEYPDGQELRLSMKPGMTGISQISGNILLSWPRRIEYDCRYVQEFNVLLDLKILLATVKVVLCGEEKFISNEDAAYHKNPIYDEIKGVK
ncbi:MAG: sugar transferase [Lachnospiraceae bacterium]